MKEGDFSNSFFPIFFFSSFNHGFFFFVLQFPAAAAAVIIAAVSSVCCSEGFFSFFFLFTISEFLLFQFQKDTVTIKILHGFTLPEARQGPEPTLTPRGSLTYNTIKTASTVKLENFPLSKADFKVLSSERDFADGSLYHIAAEIQTSDKETRTLLTSVPLVREPFELGFRIFCKKKKQIVLLFTRNFSASLSLPLLPSMSGFAGFDLTTTPVFPSELWSRGFSCFKHG